MQNVDGSDMLVIYIGYISTTSSSLMDTDHLNLKLTLDLISTWTISWVCNIGHLFELVNLRIPCRVLPQLTASTSSISSPSL